MSLARPSKGGGVGAPVRRGRAASARWRWLVSRVSLGAAALLATLGLASPARALAPDGAAIDSSDYTLDFYEGPILASSRIIGLGGSFAPLTEGVVGYRHNPAAVAMRVPWSKSWVDWELDGSITSPSSITNTDFDNNGDGAFATNAASFVRVGAGLQFGPWGLGIHADVSSFDLEARANEGSDMAVSLLRGGVVAGRSFFDGQLVFGLGFGVHAVDFEVIGGEEGTLASVAGADVQLGGMWAPEAIPIRLGVSARLPLTDEESDTPEGIPADASGNYVVEGYYIPRKITAPIELQGAIAMQLLRPLNTRWQNPRLRAHTESSLARRDANAAAALANEAAIRSRGRLLLSAGLQVTLPTRDGLGVESFMRQVVERSGRSVSLSPRLGVEGEPIPNYLILRGGTYLEPTRFAASSPRLHGTAGLDVHIPVPWSVFGLFRDDTTFRVGGAVDSAARYFGWTVSAGVWH